ncbi:anti-sigma factor [Paenibacillus pasadenensis]|uniref:anti-sigma factor n=1 Tax=Paenibacillus pasadenensis TaxID=217090 RepID=UPI0020422B05|nr:anti-sigma factor [Paenibacillus pasadenensis]MCM3746630.1 anti-sigma factor [Paenibacillus pasadenensis]
MKEHHSEPERHPCSEVELYALGLMNEEENREMDQHVLGCEYCKTELARLQELLGLLPLAAEPAEPPQGMKGRVLGAVLGRPAADLELDSQPEGEAAGASSMLKREENAGENVEEQNKSHLMEAPAPELAVEAPQARGENAEAAQTADTPKQTAPASAGATGRRRALLTAILAGAAAAMLLLSGILAQRMDGLNRENDRLAAELDAAKLSLDNTRSELEKAMQPFAGAAVNQIVSLKPVNKLVARGQAYILVDERGTHLIVQASRLPELKDEQAFQVWLIKGDKPVNAGTFKSSGNSGAVTFTFSGESFDQVAITLEPDAFGSAPRGEMVLAGALKA